MQPYASSVLALALLSLLVAAAGDVFQPSSGVSAHVWTGADAPGFVYPEASNTPFGLPSLLAKPNFGVAISGGGFRATTTALGWVRALHYMGFLNQSRYLSSNSGGSWMNGAFSYTQVPQRTFFGPYVPPANLTVAALNASLTPASYGSVIRDASIVGRAITGVLGDLFTPNDAAQVGGWSNAVGTSFLDPFDVGVQSSTVTALGTRGRVHERVAAAYPDLTVLTATPDKPFPLILGSAVLLDETQQYYPVDFTPLYIGIPPRYNATDPKLGPGFVEPLGFNSEPPRAPPPLPSPNGTQAVDVTAFFAVPLVSVVGISSSFVALGEASPSNAVQALTGTEELLYWNQQDFTGARLAFVDGGGVDNTGIIPLLRRRVTTIVAGISTLRPVTNMTAAQWAVGQYDVAGLWGAAPVNNSDLQRINDIPPAVFNELMQVFPRAAYEEFYADIQARVRAGEAPYHRAQYEVVANPLQAVEGGWTVDILILLNMENAGWEALLPPDTRQLLSASRAGARGGDRQLRGFPYISTFNADYSANLVSLLSQMSSYNMVSLRGTISDMLAAARSDGGGTAA